MKQKMINLGQYILVPISILWGIGALLIMVPISIPFVIIDKIQRKGTEREFNSPKKELLFGKNIAKEISDFKKKGFEVKKEINGKAITYRIKTKYWDLKIIVNTDEVGMDFWVINEENKGIFYHFVDTDLYPIADEEYQSFGNEIENEIVQFIKDLKNKKVFFGYIKDKSALIYPIGDGFMRWKKGWWRGASNSGFSTLEDAKEGGKFKTL